jgi:hypothetical protein
VNKLSADVYLSPTSEKGEIEGIRGPTRCRGIKTSRAIQRSNVHVEYE